MNAIPDGALASNNVVLVDILEDILLNFHFLSRAARILVVFPGLPGEGVV
jgi:hypothetical protein